MVHDLSIVIPAYDEAARLPSTLAALSDHFGHDPEDIEIILVDDGSGDATLKIMGDWCDQRPFARSITVPHGGKASAVKAGIASAARGRVMFMDADLAVPLADIANVMSELDRGADVAIGSRETWGASRLGEPPLRRLRGRAFNWLVRTILFRGIMDTQCGFKAFTRRSAKEIFSRTLLHGRPNPELRGPSVTAFDVEILYLAKLMGFKIVEVPVRWRHVPESKVRPLSDPLRMAADVFKIRFNALTGKYVDQR